MPRRLQERDAWRWIGEQFSRSTLTEVNRTGICNVIDELHTARRISAATYHQMNMRLSLFSPSEQEGYRGIRLHWWPTRSYLYASETEYQSDDQTPRVTVCCFLAAMAAPTRRKAVPRGR